MSSGKDEDFANWETRLCTKKGFSGMIESMKGGDADGEGVF